ncbi:4386_t:CDS:2, partial [Funneliformis mosseae]
ILLTVSATMIKQGSFSYFNDNTDTKSLYNVRNIRVRIERMTSEVARIYFVNDAGNLINNIPPVMSCSIMAIGFIGWIIKDNKQ